MDTREHLRKKMVRISGFLEPAECPDLVRDFYSLGILGQFLFSTESIFICIAHLKFN